jgi:nicotinate-nucleotide adenylyltransferase
LSAARVRQTRASGRATRRAIAIFGGAFDPIHSGHIAVARAAARRFRLSAIHFIPSSRPPHKPEAELTPFAHRYAMVSLACAGYRALVPSTAEAGSEGAPQVFYSIDTVRKFLHQMQEAGDRLYFLIGADAFLEIDSWKDYEELLDSCDFIVASRPGFRLDALRRVLPASLLSDGAAAKSDAIGLRRTSVYLLPTVASRVSSTEVRRRLARRQSIRGLVPRLVEDYILKQALYQ